MIETSKDLLYIVLSFCVLWLTIFISWCIYYMVMMLRQANQLVRNFREGVERVSQVLEGIKEKFEHASGYLNLIVKAVEKMTDFAKERKEKKSKRK